MKTATMWTLSAWVSIHSLTKSGRIVNEQGSSGRVAVSAMNKFSVNSGHVWICNRVFS